MKPLLVIGLGNPLMGDDGVGCAVAGRLADDPRLPEEVEVVSGGCDLLRYAAQMEGRSRVMVLDAVYESAEPGCILVFEDPGAELDATQDHAHHLSAGQAIQLLQMTMPLRATLVGIGVSSAGFEPWLSPLMESRMPAILDRVLQELVWTSSM
ncbi:MAG TPA: hydrogenase maturation protease [Candidatus Acidoferrales bacterium]|nr:hydrogenase maturation protease [Candidatus Acidoferrales bacterium]